MTDSRDIPAFGIVDPDGEHGILSVESGQGASCRLTLVSRTERGYPRHELAFIPLATWRQLAAAVQKELLRGMDPEERGPRTPTFRTGEQALSPLVTRELSVLLWALMEDGEGTHVDALLAGWRQLAREERWWLYARASNPTQKRGSGWRRALYYALTDPADTRTSPRLLDIMEAASAQKKTSGTKRKINYLDDTKKKPGPKKVSKANPRKTAIKKATPATKPTGKKSAGKTTSERPDRQKLPRQPSSNFSDIDEKP
jgi:hypothetical protein